MNITELDEFQGLTAEMVREWLLANQWEPCGSSAAHLYYQCGSGEISEALLHEDLGWVVDLLAQSYERSVQSILREINPRMRKGMPSEAAWLAHGEANGLWLCLWGDIPTNEQHWELFFRGRPFVTKLRKYDAMWEWGIRGLSWSDCPEMPHGIDFLFWPCDANGNKVRWPTDAEGNML